MHRPAYEGSIESLWRDADDGVRHIIKALRLANDFRVAFETIAPHLIADDYDRMGIAAYILARFEATPENRTNPDCVEIVGRYDATGGCLGVIADTQRATGNLADERLLAKRAASPQIQEVRP